QGSERSPRGHARSRELGERPAALERQYGKREERAARGAPQQPPNRDLSDEPRIEPGRGSDAGIETDSRPEKEPGNAPDQGGPEYATQPPEETHRCSAHLARMS